MKKFRILAAVTVLVLASLACQTLMGGGNADQPSFQYSDDAPVATSESSGDSSTPDVSGGSDSEFPMPSDALNVVSVGDVVNFQTDLTLDEAISFYRDEFGKFGYTERDILTVTTDATFSMVFDGHESGKAIAVQGVDLGDGTVNIAISLQDL